MENSLQLSRKLQKCKRRSEDVYSGDDRISELPDEIVEDILSRLTMTEAVRTSVLSRRWKGLWAFTTGSLDFDFGSKYGLFDILELDRESYISRVNKILNAHKGSTIKEFRVEFHLDSKHKSDIDSWIKFAIRKKVQRLELRLTPVDFVRAPIDPYRFYQFPAVGEEVLNMSCLTSLNLQYVNVTGDVIECLLSNYPLLEFLVIMFSRSLTGVRVVVPCPKLKHLEIRFCLDLKYLDIYSAPSLTSLSYCGPKETTLRFKNVPNLADLSLSGAYCESIVGRFSQLQIPISQIQNLCLDCATVPELHEFPELKNVKKLELHSEAFEDQSLLLSCVPIIKACPNLHRFSMWFYWAEQRDEREVQQWENCGMHKYLKEVELVRFRGTATDVELATYILSSAPFLEKIIVDTYAPCTPGLVFGGEENIYAKQCMRRLAQQFSPAAELVFF